VTYYDKALKWWDGAAWKPVFDPHVPDVSVVAPPPPGSVDTSITLTFTPATVPAGGTVTLIATPSGGSGAVRFDWWNGSQWVEFANVTAAPYQTNTIPTNKYRARYEPGPGFNPSTSNEVTVPVIAATPTTTALAVSATAVNKGSNVTFTATVSGAPSEGTVTFQYLSGSTWVNGGSAAVAGGKATFTTAPGATTSYRAVYSGGPNFGGSTSGNVAVTVRTQKTATKTVAASWSKTYQGNGTARTVSEVYQGYYSSTNGNQRGLIGFPALGLPAGSTVTKVEVYLYAAHWGDSGGGTGVFGWHGYSSAPSSYTTGGSQNQTRVAWTTKTGGKWVTMASGCHAGFASGSIKGIIVGPGVTTSTTGYYGYFNGNGQANEPQLKVTYTYWS
jgi:hypothetical protein